MDRSVQNEIQCANFTLEAAAILQVNKWILCRGEDVAGDNHVRAAEEDDAIAVGCCVRHWENFNWFFVVVLSSPIFEICIAWRSLHRRLLFLHSRLNILMADNCRALSCIRKLIREKRTGQTWIGACGLEF